MSAEKRDLVDSLVLRAPAVGTVLTAASSGSSSDRRSGERLMNAVVKRGRGKIMRQEWFVAQNGWQRTLEAAGLSE